VRRGEGLSGFVLVEGRLNPGVALKVVMMLAIVMAVYVAWLFAGAGPTEPST
jgi:hypothetical protein